MKIASYNIRKCIGLDRRRNPNRVLSVLSGLSVDIIALQEVDKRMGKRPSTLTVDQIERHTGMVPLDIGRAGPSLGWHGNTFLYHPGAELADIECLDLPGLEPRGAIIAEISLDNMAPLRLVTVHLGLLRSSRTRQLAYVRDAVAGRAKRPTVIFGDFNEWSLTRGLGTLAADFHILSPGKSYHAARPVASLDRFALSRDLHVREAGVIDTGLTRMASDHLPVWAEIAFDSKTGTGPKSA